MAKKTIEDSLRLFNEKYAAIRLPDNITQEFIKLLKCYKFDISKAISENESEEHIKNITNQFLKDSLYKEDKYQINTSNYIDSTIKCNDKLLAIMEIKKPTNKSEMVKCDDINKKALWEIVYYYLSISRNVSEMKVTRIHDCEVRRLIITNTQLWVIIDAVEIEKLCDGYLEKQYYKYKNNQLTYTNDTSKFYDDMKDYFNKIDIKNKLPFICFDIDEVLKSKKCCQQLYKILSHEFLLKDGYKQIIKSHLLNDKFYQELLFIMGLVEKKGKSNTIIKINNDIKNSFAEQVYSKYINDKDEEESNAIEKTFELVIIWMNRLLFIKLFEGQLIQFNNDLSCYHILDINKIKDFNDLQNLFFNVLGKKDRENLPFYNQFSEIPYLNSSLFERQDIERKDININEIKNDFIIKKQNSVLGNKDNNKLHLLEYLIDFLNSYTFSSQVNDNAKKTHKNDIIDASVLGLIFEKINGYKDGAVYTPSSITEYMSKLTLENAILKKINKDMNWNCLTFDDVKFNITNLQLAYQINNSINSLKICDPAVGSGHFLVSALNRIIAIKSYLGVLFKTGKQERLSEVDIFIEDDILCITNAQGDDFIYDKNNKASQEVQEALFNEKKLIIEECLFGVDINAKAVYICQLRLWIELLKNAYYKNNVMQTLPNIDINIKVGNSLISKIDFEANKKIGKKNNDFDKYTKNLIKEYKAAVKQYKSVSDKNEKQNIRGIINDIKNIANMSKSIFESDSKELYINSFEWALEFPEIISDDGIFMGFDVILGNPPYGLINKRQNQTIGIAALSSQLDYYKDSPQYKPAKGGMLNIFRLFICRSYKLLKKGGNCSLIFPISFMGDMSCYQIRKFLLEKSTINYIEAFPERDDENRRVFESAKMSVCIVGICKEKSIKNHEINLRINRDRYINTESKVCKLSIKNIKLIDNQYLTIPLVTQSELNLLAKIAKGSRRLREYSKCYTGEIDLSIDNRFISLCKDDAPMLRGAQVQKYKIINDISQGDILYLKKNEYLSNNKNPKSEHYKYRRIIMQGITGVNEKQRLKMTITNGPIFCANSVNYLIINDENQELEFMLGLLNSKVLNWFFSRLSTNSNVNGYEIDNLPIKEANEKLRQKIIANVIEILKGSDKEDSLINNIDKIIYKIYSLNISDISLISKQTNR